MRLILNEDWSGTNYTYLDFAGHTSIPTATSLGITDGNGVEDDGYIMYLFATLPGISKVGSFSHVQGTPLNVDCGFSAGARFVLVKRTDAAGDWFFWDTLRGITTGADSTLRLNTTQAEEFLNYISPLAAGFTATGLPTGDYIFYAVA